MLQEDENRKRGTPGFFGFARQPHRAQMIDVEGQLRIEIPQRIIGQRRQVDHRVKSLQVGGLHIAQVLDDLRNRDRLGPEGARAIQMRVQTRPPRGPPSRNIGTRTVPI